MTAFGSRRGTHHGNNSSSGPTILAPTNHNKSSHSARKQQLLQQQHPAKQQSPPSASQPPRPRGERRPLLMTNSSSTPQLEPSQEETTAVSKQPSARRNRWFGTGKKSTTTIMEPKPPSTKRSLFHKTASQSPSCASWKDTSAADTTTTTTAFPSLNDSTQDEWNAAAASFADSPATSHTAALHTSTTSSSSSASFLTEFSSPQFTPRHQASSFPKDHHDSHSHVLPSEPETATPRTVASSSSSPEAAAAASPEWSTPVVSSKKKRRGRRGSNQQQGTQTTSTPTEVDSYFPQDEDEDEEEKKMADESPPLMLTHSTRSVTPKKGIMSSHGGSTDAHHMSSSPLQRTPPSSAATTPTGTPVSGSTKKALLSRPFGMASLSSSSSSAVIIEPLKYLVQVSPATWNDGSHTWQYQILVQQRKHSNSGTTSVGNHATDTSVFTQAFTYRSWPDFEWLEQSLRLEFQGSLVLPLLHWTVGNHHNNHNNTSLASLDGSTAAASPPVQATMLQTWLTQVLNPIRGQGEWSLSNNNHNNNPETITILESESMEAFLYKQQQQQSPQSSSSKKNNKKGRQHSASPSSSSSLAQQVPLLESIPPQIQTTIVRIHKQQLALLEKQQQEQQEQQHHHAINTPQPNRPAVTRTLSTSSTTDPDGTVDDTLTHHDDDQATDTTTPKEEHGNLMKQFLQFLPQSLLLGELCTGPTSSSRPTDPDDDDDDDEDRDARTVDDGRTVGELSSTWSAQQARHIWNHHAPPPHGTHNKNNNKNKNHLDSMVVGNHHHHKSSSKATTTSPRHSKSTTTAAAASHMARLHYSSRALETAPSLEVLDSFAEHSVASGMAAPPPPHQPPLPSFRHSQPHQRSSPTISGKHNSFLLAIHSEAIEAQQDLLDNYRQTAVDAQGQCRAVMQLEERLAVSWKKLALAMANVFCYEKEVETAKNSKLGDALKVKKEHLPYRKVTKAMVEDGLRNLAQAKADRGLPALQVWNSTLLDAYVADLSSVRPSVDMYLAAIHTLSLVGPAGDNNSGGLGPDGGEDEDYDEDDSLYPEKSKHKNHKKQSNNKKSPQNKRHLRDSNPVILSSTTNESLSSLYPSRRSYPQRVLARERSLCEALTQLGRATPLRVARMAWWYLKTEATQCANLHAAAHGLRTQVALAHKDSAVSETAIRHQQAQVVDDQAELDVTQRIVNLRLKMSTTTLLHEDGSNSINGAATEDEIAQLRNQAVAAVQGRLGRWNTEVGLIILEAVGIQDPVVQLEDATRDLKVIRKYASGLQECLNKCAEAIEQVRAVLRGMNQTQMLNTSMDTHARNTLPTTGMRETRKAMVCEMAKLFSGRYIHHDENQQQVLHGDHDMAHRDASASPISRRTMPSITVLARCGIDMTDPLGWMTALNREEKQSQQTKSSPAQKTSKSRRPPSTSPKTSSSGLVGDLFFAYMEARDSRTECLLNSLSDLLREYQERVEIVEGYVYMQCVGMKLEKHFNEKRTKALTAFERKTDITSAMNVATRKRLPHLVKELQSKLDTLGPEVSHTVVKETKELHLESKVLKTELSDLATRRLLRARETSTEKAIALLTLWTKEEESCCTFELQALGEAMAALEKQVVVMAPEQPASPTSNNNTAGSAPNSSFSSR